MGGGVVLKTSDGGATWTKITTPNGGNSVLAIYFISPSNGWATGAAGTIEHTTDGGTTWQLEQSGTVTRALRAVAFVDADHGWAAGDYGTILRTTTQSPPTTALTLTPAGPNGLNGWYVTAPTISLAATSAVSTWYSWSSIAGPWTQYSAAFPAVEGAHTLYYYSVGPGNSQESPKQTALKVDLTAPTVPGALAATSIGTSTVTALLGPFAGRAVPAWPATTCSSTVS